MVRLLLFSRVCRGSCATLSPLWPPDRLSLSECISLINSLGIARTAARKEYLADPTNPGEPAAYVGHPLPPPHRRLRAFANMRAANTVLRTKLIESNDTLASIHSLCIANVRR